MEIVIERQDEGGAVVLAVRGELDVESGPRMREALLEAIGEGGRRVVVDLEGVSFIDSAGLAALLNVLRRATAARAPLVLIRPGPQVRGILAQTRLDREFTFAATVEDAEDVSGAR